MPTKRRLTVTTIDGKRSTAERVDIANGCYWHQVDNEYGHVFRPDGVLLLSDIMRQEALLMAKFFASPHPNYKGK